MSGAAQMWRRALSEGRLMLQRPAGGGRAIFPPREFAPETGEDVEWFEASGRGTVYSVTWVKRRPPEPDFNVVLVELEEGARMMGKVEGVDEEALRIGMAVRARIAEGVEGAIVLFEPEKVA